MSGPVGIRHFLLQQGIDSASSFAAVPTQRSPESPRVSDKQVRRAQLAVAYGSINAEDCRELLDMLGLTPNENGLPPVMR